jgi:FtsZ-interacting cell division protein ZipA
MSSASAAVIIVVVIVVVALIIPLTMTARRKRLQQRFGPEYDRAVSERQTRLRAEAELTGRQRRVRRLHIRPLSDAARARYLARWQDIQEQFVDEPETAVTSAYTLVITVMRERGYPATDDEQTMADLSVDHAATVGHFRAAYEVTRNVAHGSTDTEDLRQALIHYRELFADLLGGNAGALGPAATRGRHAEGPSPDVLAPGPVGPARITTPASDPDDPSWQQGRSQ